jgi:curved DNA-binding protein CbpA
MTSTLPPDPWKALGVERDADKSEIRTAYKKLVLKCHPDKIQDPELKALKADEFQKVQEAWELLNDDAGLAKYEQKLRLAELQRAAKVQQQEVKNSPNTSVPRTSTKYATYDIRTAEPTSRYKSSPSGGKVYTHYTTTHTRSHEEMPSSRIYPLYEEGDRQARRTASYEKPAKRDDERRERDRDERRRRREEEEFKLQNKERERERDRDRERERERKKEEERALKSEKKRLEREREREREKDRKRDAEDKARRHKPYVEHYDTYDTYIDEIILEDEKHVTSSSRSDKKRSSSRKHDETRERERERERDRDRERDREREKSSSRRTKSPHLSSSDRKHMNLYETAASYLASAGSAQSSQMAAFWKSQTPPETSFVAPLAPTPPPVEFEEESSLRQAASRAAGRRASNDAARSREKLKYETLDVTPPKSRPIPTLSKSYSTPPPAPESPPRGISRSQTTPHEPSYRPIPTLARNQTWAATSIPTAEYYDDVESEDDRERRRHRSRRTRSPSGQPTHRYKVVDGLKTSKLEPQYVYGESPTATRRYAAEALDGHVAHSPSSATYTSGHLRVKEAKAYGLNDVTYAQYEKPSYYSSHAADGYAVPA